MEERQDVRIDYSRNKNNMVASVDADRNVGISISISISNKGANRVYIREEELDSYRYIHPYMYERKLMEGSIKVKDIVQRIVALSYMANEKVYSEDDRKSFLDEAKYLIQLLKDFGYDGVI